MAVQVRQDLDFSEAGVGVAVGGFFLTASGLSAPMGRFAERVGGGRALRLAALWAAMGAGLVAVGAHSLPLLTVILAFSGGANALGQPAANLVIARALPGNRQGVGFAVKQSAIPFATVLGGLAVPALALTVGWRWAFVAAGVLAGVAAGLVPVPADGAGWRRAVGPAGTLGAFLVSSAVETGMAEGTAGLALSVGSGLGILVRLGAGVLADRRSGGHLRWVAAMLALGAFGYLLFATGRPGLFLAGLPLAFGAGWAWPGLFNLAIVLANPASPAAATGVTQTGTYLGAVLGPLLFGLVAQQLSFAWSWVLAALISFLAAGAIWTGRAMLRRSLRS